MSTTQRERRYLPATLVIETTFETEAGTVKRTDAMAFAEGQRHQELRFSAPHLILRLVEGRSASETRVWPRAEATGEPNCRS